MLASKQHHKGQRSVNRRKKKRPVVLKRRGENKGVLYKLPEDASPEMRAQLGAPVNRIQQQVESLQSNVKESDHNTKKEQMGQVNEVEIVLKNGYTSLTLVGNYTDKQIKDYQLIVDKIEGLRVKTLKVMMEAREDFTSPEPISSSMDINSIPITISLDSSIAYAEVRDDSVIVYHELFSKMSEGFQISVLAHEIWAHYFENQEDLIPDGENVSEVVKIENPFFDPNLPDKGSNSRYLDSFELYGSMGTVKEEINGWTLQKYLAENGYIQVTNEELERINETLNNYKSKKEKMEQLLREQKKSEGQNK